MKISDNLKFKLKELGGCIPFLRRSSYFSPGIELEHSYEMLSVDYPLLRKNDLEPSIDFPPHSSAPPLNSDRQFTRDGVRK